MYKEIIKVCEENDKVIITGDFNGDSKTIIERIMKDINMDKWHTDNMTYKDKKSKKGLDNDKIFYKNIEIKEFKQIKMPNDHDALFIKIKTDIKNEII